MAINLDTNVLAARTAQLKSTSDEAQTASLTKMTALLGGASLKVSDGAYTDLEALVARLKDEEEKTRFSMLLSSLDAVGDSLTLSQKQALEEGVALSQKLSLLEGDLASLKASLETQKGDAAIMQAKIDALGKQIEQAVKDGKEHNELVQKQKAAKAELEAKKTQIAETSGRINDVTNEISVVKGKISAAVKSIGENTLKAIATQIASLAGPEKGESAAESEKKEKKAEETNLFNAIRDSLDKFRRELEETIESKIETMV